MSGFQKKWKLFFLIPRQKNDTWHKNNKARDVYNSTKCTIIYVIFMLNNTKSEEKWAFTEEKFFEWLRAVVTLKHLTSFAWEIYY